MINAPDNMTFQLSQDNADDFLADAREDLDRVLGKVSEEITTAINTATDSEIQNIGPHKFFISQWRKLRPLYKQLAGNVADYCKTLLSKEEIECLVYARAKGVESAERTLVKRIQWGEKYQKPIRTLEDMLSEMHDLAGTMIVVNRPKMEAVNNIIKEFFREVGRQTEWEAPQQHISSLGNHRSYNHHVTLSETRCHEAVKFEIQVVSYQSHTYNMVSHDWQYKGMYGPLEGKDEFVLEILKSTGCTYDLVSQYFDHKRAESSIGVGQRKSILGAQNLTERHLSLNLTMEQIPTSTAMNEDMAFWRQAKDDIIALNATLKRHTHLLQRFDLNARAAIAQYYDISRTNKTGGHTRPNDLLCTPGCQYSLEKTHSPDTKTTAPQASNHASETVSKHLHLTSISNSPLSDLPKNTWVRSVTSFIPLQYGPNWIFGTLMIKTTVISYKRSLQGGSEVEEKQEELKSIRYIPPRWISSRGVVYSKITTRWNLHTQADPAFRLRTVNIISIDSDLFEACRNWDFPTVYKLFKTQKASPYDVDNKGRNILGWLSLGPGHHDSWFRCWRTAGRYLTDVNVTRIGRAMEEFVILVKRLVEYGVDPSELEDEPQ
ncbi:hypothetical protein F5Y16DRAFT_18486 [Xylariaceae sp. FL0255]|nr:hypothetical protein F5Y16DRAFT_18486 [Xylariaceae sp. FL0255]